MTTVKRNSIPTIRESMLERGALLLKFDRPSEGSSPEEHITWFNQMQELGFRVTTAGCLLPYENFKGSSKARPKGHKVAAFFFKGNPPTYPSHPHGWPVFAQVSHLCHRKTCVNPNHIVYEPQWKNLKRNYCGENGSCDCRMTPACLAIYHNGEWIHKDEFLTYDTEGFEAKIAIHLSGLSYAILSKDHFNDVDKKKEQRNERLRAKRKYSQTK